MIISKYIQAAFWQRLSLKHDTLLLLICIIFYIFTAGGHFISTDEESLYQNTVLLSSKLGIYSEAITYRNPQEIGQSLIALPFYWVAKTISQFIEVKWHAYLLRAIMTTFNIGVTLATIWVLYQWTYQLTTSSSISIVMSSLYGLSSLAWPYTKTFYREPLVGLCLLISFWFAYRFRESNKRVDFLISCAAIILAVSTKVVAIMAVGWWLLYWIPLNKINTVSHWVRFGVISAIVGIIVIFVFPTKQELLSNYSQEIYFDLQQNSQVFFLYGFYGLLASPGKGLIICSPPIILSFLGFPKFWQRHRKDAIIIGGLFLTFLLVYSTRRGWHGGACWGPRYLLPILPLAMLPSIEAIKLCYHDFNPSITNLKLMRITVFVIGLVGFFVQLSAVSISPINYYLVRIHEGIVNQESYDGGPKYLQELFFEPKYSPILGQATLAIERLVHGWQYGHDEQLGILPAEANSLVWDYFISLETLDFWWLHLLKQSAPEVVPNDHLGMVLIPTESTWLQLAKDGGALYNRWQLNWRDIEPIPNQFNFQQTDKQLQSIKLAGMETSLILTYPPEWATNSNSHVPKGLDLPIDSEQNFWARFVRATVTRYPNIIYWEIWNEPDMNIYWNGTPEEYFKLLRVSYLVIKETNPKAQVIMGGLSYWSDNDYFEKILNHIMADKQAPSHNYYFDISAWHWYVKTSDLYDKVVWAKKTMAKHQLYKPIWVNETNISLRQETADITIEKNNPITTATPSEQASFIVQAITNGLAAGADKIFVFRLDDAGMPEKWGLVTNKQEPRLAYVAFQAVAEFLNKATPVERKSQDGVTQITFKLTDGQFVRVLWNETPIAKQWTIAVNQPLVKLGYPNRSLLIKAVEAGKLHLQLPPATLKYGNSQVDYAVGGMPIFVFTQSITP